MSSRNHDDNTASAPLLGGEQEDEPRDVRFAISEEDAEDSNDVEDGGAKYPPPSSLPPSYNEATHRRDPWYKSEVALSLHHYGRICLGGSASFLRRYWPTSRFAQASFFIVGLWILVIVSGPTWDTSGRLGMGKGGDDLLAALPPPPLMGDGHYLQSAIWSPPTCHPTPTGMATYCTRTSTYNLTYPRADSSFRSSDKVFVFVDPLRGHGFSDERGRVPSAVEVRVDESAPREEALVTVEAQYEQELQALLERANVGLMAAGIRDRGVGIYTWPLPFHLRIVPVHLYPYPLLSFKITVRIHPQSQIPNFIIDGAKMDVGLFRELPKQGGGKGGKEIAERSEEGLQMLDIGRLKTIRLGHAIGKHRAEEAERVRKRNDDEAAWPFFGIVRLVTGEGNLLFGGHTRVMGRIWAATKGGSIDIGQDARLRGIELHLDAAAVHHNSSPKLVRDRDGGDLTIAKGAQLDAKDIVALYSNGTKGVQIGDDAWISATRLTAEVKGAGGIASADSSEWRSNHSLALLVNNGGIVAPLSVSPPTRYELGTGTEQRPWVGVDATASNGDVSLRFKHHEASVPVRVSAKTIEKGNVEVAMREEYSGSFHVKAPNRGGSSVVPPKQSGKDAAAAAGTRVFSSKAELGGDASKAFDTSGEVWWRKKEGDQHAQGEDWGQVELDAATSDAGATAKLSFDA